MIKMVKMIIKLTEMVEIQSEYDGKYLAPCRSALKAMLRGVMKNEVLMNEVYRLATEEQYEVVSELVDELEWDDISDDINKSH